MRPLSMIIATLLSLHAFCTLSAPSASKGGLTLVFIYLYSHLDLRKLTAKRLRSSLGSALGSACSTRSTRALARMRKVHGISDLAGRRDRKSTRLNSSHVAISYAVFCLKKKK